MIDPRAIPDLTRWYEGSKGAYRPGCWYQCSPSVSVTTNNALGNGILRVAPMFVPRGITLDRLGLEVTGAGDADSVLRIGIYKDNGDGFPGDLLIDAGTVPGDAIAACAEITIDQIVRKGLYWVGAVPQGVTTTQPTVRAFAPGAPLFSTYVPLTTGTAPIANAALNIGWAKTGVTGALPSTWGTGVSPTSVAARVMMRVAA